MSRSFLVDLSAYTLYRTVGIGTVPLKRAMGVSDLVSILMDLGYRNIDTGFGQAYIWGIDMNNLRGTLMEMVVGVPSTAEVNISLLGPLTDKALVTLRY